jgi:hypothetical protein
MKTITKFQADDGCEFKTSDECQAHESLCAAVVKIMSKLTAEPKDDHCNFSNGRGYIQHDPLTFLDVRNALLELGAAQFSEDSNLRVWFEQCKDGKRHVYWISRLLDDNGQLVILRAWNRIMNTDDSFREWGQMYFVLNPNLISLLNADSEPLPEARGYGG